MQKRIKNSNLLFIWLTGLMFFAHGITPHHHHFDSVYEHSQQAGQDDEHSEDNPAHCHAFNDLVVDNTGTSFSNFSIFNSFTGLIIEHDLYLRNTENSCGFTYRSKQDKSPTKETFLKNSPTRGSPVLL